MTDAENVDKKGRKRSKKRLRPFAFPTLQLRPRTENQPVEPIPTEPTADENIMENDVEVGAVPTTSSNTKELDEEFGNPPIKKRRLFDSNIEMETESPVHFRSPMKTQFSPQTKRNLFGNYLIWMSTRKIQIEKMKSKYKKRRKNKKLAEETNIFTKVNLLKDFNFSMLVFAFQTTKSYHICSEKSVIIYL